MNLQI